MDDFIYFFFFVSSYCCCWSVCSCVLSGLCCCWHCFALFLFCFFICFFSFQETKLNFKFERSNTYFCWVIYKVSKREQKCLVKGLLQLVLYITIAWVDFNSNYCLPVPIAFTHLRTDVTIWSNHSRRLFSLN